MLGGWWGKLTTGGSGDQKLARPHGSYMWSVFTSVCLQSLLSAMGAWVPLAFDHLKVVIISPRF